jgi:hypothetical protein
MDQRRLDALVDRQQRHQLLEELPFVVSRGRLHRPEEQLDLLMVGQQRVDDVFLRRVHCVLPSHSPKVGATISRADLVP